MSLKVFLYTIAERENGSHINSQVKLHFYAVHSLAPSWLPCIFLFSKFCSFVLWPGDLFVAPVHEEVDSVDAQLKKSLAELTNSLEKTYLV